MKKLLEKGSAILKCISSKASAKLKCQKGAELIEYIVIVVIIIAVAVGVFITNMEKSTSVAFDGVNNKLNSVLNTK